MRKIATKFFLMALLFVANSKAFAQPTITSFSPATAKPGDAVTITGTNFNTTVANNIVFFGATRATVTAASATSITVTVPTGATHAPITVLNTSTRLTAYSRTNFIPVYSPSKTTISSTDFMAKQDFSTAADPYAVAIGDLDGDGKADLAVTNFNANTISIFRNTSSNGTIGSGSFAANQDLTTGTNPRSIAIGDLDGDGKLDLVVTNQGSATISILRNTNSIVGTISFAAKQDYSTGNDPFSVAINDLDGDGKADLAVSNYSSNTVSVFHNNNISVGTISFATSQDFTTGTNPISVAISDLDGDGKADIAVANLTTNNVSVFRNTYSSVGIISFAAKQDFSAGGGSFSLAIGDLDGDGKADIAVANRSANTVSVLRNTNTTLGTIAFATNQDFTTGTSPRSVAIGDLDGDGKLDLVVGNYNSNTVSVFRNISSSGSIGSGSFASSQDFTTGTNPSSVAIGDLDGDGKADLAVANNGVSATTVSVLRSTDLILPPTITGFSPASAKPGDAVTLTGTFFNTTAANNIVFFGATKATVTASTATSITVTVPIGATYAPITVLNTGTVLAGYSQNNFNPVYVPAKVNITATDFSVKQDFTTGSIAYSVAIGDLDGDGKADLAVANYTSATISIFRNTGTNGILGTGSFAAKQDFTTGTAPYSIAIGDLDGDGKLDLAVANITSNTVSILRNTSSIGSIDINSFAAKQDFITGTSPNSVAIRDLDGDGSADLAVTNANSNTVSVFRNTSSSIGTISFAAKQDFIAGTSPSSVAIGDLDGDGKPDLAVANKNTSNVSVFRNTSTRGSIGSSSFAAKQDFSAGTNPVFITIGDLDGDGKLDLATANFGTTTTSVFRNTSSLGTISLATKQDFTTGTGSSAMAIADLDGDGKPDLAVVNTTSATVSVLRNTSTSGSIFAGSFATKQDFVTGIDPASLAISDLDGDGKPDLALANSGSATVSVLRSIDPPTITSFTPSSAKPGDAVTITGTFFNTTPANNIVFFGATRATVTASTATSITATVPTGASYAPITVLNTSTVLAAYSRANFNPIYAPTKTSINVGDFSTKQDFATTNGPISTVIGDLDGDGKADLVVVNQTANSVSVFRNTSSIGSIVTGSFAAKQDFAAGSFPFSVAIGDLDGDGKLDLVVANYTSNNVSILRNTSNTVGTISFAAKQDFGTGVAPFSVAIGDLDGDGKLDLAAANFNVNTLSVLRNTSSSAGTINFAAKQDFVTGMSPYSIAIGDLDGDGKADLVTANNGAVSVSIFRNTSNRGIIDINSFATKQDFTTASTPYSVAIGDLDGDGKADLAVACANQNIISVLRNTNTTLGTFSFAIRQDYITGINPRSVAIGDLDGDGKADLVTANFGSNNVSIFRNTSTGIGVSSFADQQIFPTANGTSSIAIGDLDGDGRLDLATANANSNNVSVLRNADIVNPPTITSFTPASAKPGDAVTIIGTNFNTTPANNIVFFGATKAAVTAATATSITATVPYGATYATITGLNAGNGLVAYSQSNFNPIYAPAKTNITLNDFLPKQDFVAGTLPYSVAIGDLDGDGRPDLAVANTTSNTVSIYLNTSTNGTIGSSSFAAKQDFTTRSKPTSVAIGDLDGDGKPDLAVACNTGAPLSLNFISIFRNTSNTLGTISFAAKQDFAAANPSYVVISDLDGDGKPDLISVSSRSNSLSIFRNNSIRGSIDASSFAAKQDFLTSSIANSVAIGDLDGDGKPDLAVANISSNTISIYRNTSIRGRIDASSFAAKQDFTTGTGPNSVTIGDIDGDGKADLAVANSSAVSVSILRNTSTIGIIDANSFATNQDFATGDNPRSVAIGDLDGDGKPDLAVANFNATTVSVFRNTSSIGSIGVGSFAAKRDFTTGSSPVSVAIGDLDVDGKLDLAIVNSGSTSNSVSVLRNADIILPPTITSFAPVFGPIGSLVTITGTNLNNQTALSIGGVAAIPISNTSTTIVAMVMPGATTGSMSVTTIGGVAISAGNFTITQSLLPNTQQGNKLVGTLNSGTSLQGVSVAISADGNTAIVGAQNDNGGIGAAWVYNRTVSGWAQQGAKLVGTGSVGAANQGSSVALSADGNTAVVGGKSDNNTGAVWVYIRTGTSWAQQGSKLVGLVGGANSGSSQQGFSVSLSADGNTVLVGAPNDNSGVGAVWIFTRSGGIWVQQGSKLVGSDFSGIIAVSQGVSVCLSADGNNAIVGGNGDNGGIGAAWVYTRTGSSWIQQGVKLVGSGISGNTSQQGSSVALSADGNTAVVGGQNDDGGKGAAWVFSRSGSIWTQQGSKLVGTDKAGVSSQGSSVGLSADGNTAIVGGSNDNLSQGAAWLYSRTGSIWAQQGNKIVGTGNQGGAQQGYSIALSADGNTAILGGPSDNSRIGAAWVFVAPKGPIVTATLAAFGSCVGLAGSQQSFTISGNALSDNILVNAPPGYEVSTTSGSGFGASVSLTQSLGSLFNTTIYVRIAATAIGTPSGNITITSTGYITQNVAVSGTVNASPTISSFAPASGPIGTLVTITGTGLNNPTGITIGGVAAIAVSSASTQLVGMVMPGANAGNIVVSGSGCSVTSNGGFTITAPVTPSIQQSKLVGTRGSGTASQGFSVAISADGNTAIVGGTGDNNGIGAVWIYTRTGSTWTQQGPKLVGTGNIGSSNQGWSVALSADGNTAIVGGYKDSTTKGAVWIFTRNGSTWSQQGSKLVGTGFQRTVRQGYSVSISADGNTAIVGGNQDNGAVGAAWIFTRSGGIWSQQGNKLVGSSSLYFPEQGTSVFLSADGNTAIIGGPSDNSSQGAAWVYTRVGSAWLEQIKLVGTGNIGAAKHGVSVALSANGNTAIVGGYQDSANLGAVWIYTRTGTTWTQQASRLVGRGNIGNAYQGWSVAINADGNMALVGGISDDSNKGAVWVFTRSGNTWTQQGEKLVGTVTQQFVQQGRSVSLSADGNTALFGGPSDNSGLGAAWVFVGPSGPAVTASLTGFTGCAGTPSSQQNFTVSGILLTANVVVTAPTGFEVSTNSGSGFGSSVTLTQTGGTLAGTTIYVRMNSASAGIASGNITVATTGFTTQNIMVGGTVNALPTITSFTPVSGPIGTLVTLTGTSLSNPSAFTIGGVTAIAVNGTSTQLVGMVMPGATAGNLALTTNGCNATSASNFTITASIAPNIQQGLKLLPSDNTGSTPYFGYSVAVSADGNTAIMGGYNDNSAQGAAWVYTRSGGIWVQQGLKLVGGGAQGTPRFGISVALSADGNTAIVGGNSDNANQGAAWIFTRNGGVWSSQGAKLVGTGGSTVARQGFSVALSADGNTAIVGGYSDNSNVGAAWVYIRTGTSWAQQGLKLVGNDYVSTAQQGWSVSLSADGNTALVGGSSDNNATGAAWIYTRSGGTWTQQGSKLVGIGNQGAAQQGSSVSLSADGNTAIVGGYADNSQLGAAWVFRRTGSNWSQQGNKLVGTGGTIAARQGYSVSLSADGNTAIVGGNLDNNYQGAAWVYKRTGTAWSQQINRLLGTGNSGAANQGLSVAVSADGNTALVGGYADNNGRGAVWPFIGGTLSPTVTTTGTLTAFATCTGSASTQQSFTISGTNLTADITLTAPTGYEISTSSASDYTSALTLARSSGTVASTTIYVRLAATATGTPNGNIAATSAGAASVNIAASGTVNTLPTITLGTVTNINTSAATFSLPYSATTGNPDQYSITTASPTAMSSFTPVTNTTLVTSPLNINIPISGANTYNFNAMVRNTSTGCVSDNAPFTVTVLGPTVTTTGSLTDFSTCAGTASASQNFSVSGANLTANVIVTAPTGFEVSTTAGSGYGASITLTPSSGTITATNIYARLSIAATGQLSSSIAVTSINATTQNISVTGTANALPTVSLGTVSNVFSNATNFSLPYTVTTGSPNQYNITSGTPVAMSNFTAVTNAILGASPISVTIPASAVGTYNFNATVRNTITGCVSTSTPFTLQVVAAPVVTVTGTTGNFATCIGTASAVQSFTVSGSNLIANLTVTAPTGYEVSTSIGSGYASNVNLTPTVGSVASTTVYTRLSSTASSGANNGNITVSSISATTQTLSLSGSVGATVTVGNNPSVVNGTIIASLFYGNTTGNPDQYSISWNTASIISGFTNIGFTSLPASSISVTIPASPGDGVYPGTLVLKNSSNGCVSPNIPFNITVAPPTITTTGTLTTFNNCAGTASVVQSFTAGSTSLSNNVTVTAPTGFEVSLSNSSGFGTSLTLVPQSGTINTTVFVRLNSIASGTPSGNITLVSTTAEATQKNVAVTGTVNVLPTITLGSITNILATATSFNLPYSATSASPDQYSITTGTPTAISGFTAVSNATLGASPLSITIPASAAGIYNFNASVRNSTTGCTSQNTPFTVTVSTPTVSSSGTLSNFTTCAGTASSTQNITVSGANLTANLVVTAPSGFEVSASSNSSFSSTVSLTPTLGLVSSTLIYVRLSSSASGGQNGSISIASTSAITQFISASGSVNALPSMSFGAVSNIGTDATSFTLPFNGSATTGAPNQYSITAGTPTTLIGFTNINNATIGSNTINVPIPASAINTYNFLATVRNSTTGCVSASTPFTVQVVLASPTIVVTGSLTTVPTTYGTASASPSFIRVSASNLTNNLLIAPPAGYEVSTNTNEGYTSSLSLTPVSGTVTNTVVYIRLAATTAVGNYSGNIVCSSTGATNQNIATVSSTVSAANLTINIDDVNKTYGQIGRAHV